MVQTKFDTRSQATVAVTTGLFVLYIFMAIIGNSFVCLALYRNRRLRPVTNLYVLALAVGEIFMASVVFLFSVIASILRECPVSRLHHTLLGWRVNLHSSINSNESIFLPRETSTSSLSLHQRESH